MATEAAKLVIGQRARRISSERQVFDPFPPLVLRCCGGDQFKILNHLAYGDPKLVRVDDAGEVLMFPLPSCSLAEEIAVLRDEYAPKPGRPLQ
jgi:hypothetical protein